LLAVTKFAPLALALVGACAQVAPSVFDDQAFAFNEPIADFLEAQSL
jgi:hypothetical protein